MPAALIDTSLTGYTSGSVDNQDDIYRNRQRPQPFPLVQNDSGYQSSTRFTSSNFLEPSPSLIGLANSLKCDELLNNESNFSLKTDVECYENDVHSIKRQRLDENAFLECLSSSRPDQSDPAHRVLIFFVTLEATEGATYRARASLSKPAIEALISQCGLNALFVPDLLGRPNYWSPELYSRYSSEGAVESVDFFCQQPRFAIHSPNFKQRSPVSVYMRYEAAKNLTYYIVSSPESEECVKGFKNILNIATHDGSKNNPPGSILRHPLEAHILLSKVLCESSQGYIHLFRQSMFAQLRAVDELSVQESTADRKGLADVTIELQIISKDVNKLISDVDVASRNLAKTQEALTRLDQHSTSSSTPSSFPSSTNISSTPENHRQQLSDALQYLFTSMDKQKMWLYNYRDRKDIAMSLVFNLVTQQDAANNISITKKMKQDSSSMNGIALLTMVFLPGTFTSTLLGAGLFSAFAQNRDVHVSGLWWFWAAITFPLTGFVLLLWGALHWRRKFRAWLERRAAASESKGNSGSGVEAKV